MENSELQDRNQKYKCPYCDKEIKVIWSLKQHIMKNHLTIEFYCPYCNEEFETLQKLRFHLFSKNDRFHQKLYFLILRKHIKREDKEFLFSNNQDLVKNDNENKKIIIGFECPFCKHKSLRLKNIYEHVIDTHYNNSVKCPHCNFIANSLAELKAHSQSQKDSYHKVLFKFLSRKLNKYTVRKQFMIK